MNYMIQQYVIFPFSMVEDGMSSTLPKGRWFFINKIVYGLEKPLSQHLSGNRWWAHYPKRGDLIAFSVDISSRSFLRRVLHLPVFLISLGTINTLPKHLLVRRVVGVPGDRIFIQEKQIIINGRPFEPTWQITYADAQVLPLRVSERDFMKEEVFVERDRFFVLCDAWDRVSDSRVFGLVEFRNVHGKVSISD